MSHTANQTNIATLHGDGIGAAALIIPADNLRLQVVGLIIVISLLLVIIIS